MNTLKTRIVASASAILVTLILVAALPSATGQYVPVACDVVGVSTLSLSGDTAEIPPGDVAEISVEYEYKAPEPAFSLEPVEIEFTVRGEPAWADVTLSETVVFVEVKPLEVTEETGTITLTITLHEDAPEGEIAQFEVEGDAREGTCVTAAQASADAEILVAETGEESEAPADEPPEANENSIPAPAALTGLVALFAVLIPLARRRR